MGVPALVSAMLETKSGTLSVVEVSPPAGGETSVVVSGSPASEVVKAPLGHGVSKWPT